MTFVEQMKDAVMNHGEVHAIVEEHEAEVELRRGTTSFDNVHEVVKVEDGDTVHVFRYDSFVHFYRPLQVFHE